MILIWCRGIKFTERPSLQKAYFAAARSIETESSGPANADCRTIVDFVVWHCVAGHAYPCTEILQNYTTPSNIFKRSTSSMSLFCDSFSLTLFRNLRPFLLVFRTAATSSENKLLSFVTLPKVNLRPIRIVVATKSLRNKDIWWTRPGSNRRPHRCERCALPAELLAHE
jgi:hypothetical protein